MEVEFSGTGFVITGTAQKEDALEDLELQLELSVDEGVAERFTMPTNFSKRRHEVAWKYQLPEGKHRVKISLINPQPGYRVDVNDLIVYASKKASS